MNMWREGQAAVCCLLMIALGLAGCSSSKVTESTIPSTHENPPAREKEASPPPPPRSPDKTYAYRITNDDCNCSEYHTADPQYPVKYQIRAEYRMKSGFLTSIIIKVENDGPDSLYFGQGSVRVSSLNMNFQYNNRFIALPALVIPPNKSDEVKLSGKEITEEDDWHKIAGEQMTVTIKGLRLGENELKPQKITFVPENPYLESGGY